MRRRKIGNTASIGREDGKAEEAQAIYIKASYRFLFAKAQTLLNQTPYSSHIIFVVVVVVVINPSLLCRFYVLAITFPRFIIVFALPDSPSAPKLPACLYLSRLILSLLLHVFLFLRLLLLLLHSHPALITTL